MTEVAHADDFQWLFTHDEHCIVCKLNTLSLHLGL
jgi:hypothetical protein